MLSRLRDGELDLTPARTSVLLRMVDCVRSLLTSIEASGGEGSVDVTAVVAAISAAMDDAPAKEPAPAAPPAARPAATRTRKATAKTPAAKKAPAAVAPAEDAVLEVLVTDTPVDTPVAEAAVPQPRPAADDPAEHADGEAAPPAEGAPGQAGRRAVADSTIRVDVDLLDELMLLVGELVLTRNQIVQYVGRSNDTDLLRASQRLNLIASELQEGVMKTRMQPIDHIWSKLPRVVRDLGLQLKKSIRLEMEGRDTELDKTLLEAVKDPLTHLVRNSVDHGIEAPEVRRSKGKPAEGVLTLRARHESGQVVVEVADDGAGIDPARVGAKAVERGLLSHDALNRMSPQDLLQMIFLPGFSTASAVTNVSGRGVGMDVVKTNIEAIGGTIEVESIPGEGTVCRLRIPLTLAIVPALTVECAGDRYAIPQISLQELVSLDAEKAANAVEEVGGAPVYRLRGELLPLVRLTDVLGLPSDRHDGHVVIAVLRSEGRRFGLVVDRVMNRRPGHEHRGDRRQGRRRAAQGDRPVLGCHGARRRHGRAHPRRPGALPPGAAHRDRRAARGPRGRRGRRGRRQGPAADAAGRHRRWPPRGDPARHRHPPGAGAHRERGEGRQPRGGPVPRRDPAHGPARPAPGGLRRERP